MNSSAPLVGVVELPALAAALHRAGYQVITGSKPRDAATSIRGALDSNDPFPVFVSDAPWPGLRTWTDKAARETTVVVVHGSAGTGTLFTGVSPVTLPKTLIEVAAAGGLSLPPELADLPMGLDGAIPGFRHPREREVSLEDATAAQEYEPPSDPIPMPPGPSAGNWSPETEAPQPAPAPVAVAPPEPVFVPTVAPITPQPAPAPVQAAPAPVAPAPVAVAPPESASPAAPVEDDPWAEQEAALTRVDEQPAPFVPTVTPVVRVPLPEAPPVVPPARVTPAAPVEDDPWAEQEAAFSQTAPAAPVGVDVLEPPVEAPTEPPAAFVPTVAPIAPAVVAEDPPAIVFDPLTAPLDEVTREPATFSAEPPPPVVAPPAPAPAPEPLFQAPPVEAPPVQEPPVTAPVVEAPAFTPAPPVVAPDPAPAPEPLFQAPPVQEPPVTAPVVEAPAFTPAPPVVAPDPAPAPEPLFQAPPPVMVPEPVTAPVVEAPAPTFPVAPEPVLQAPPPPVTPVAPVAPTPVAPATFEAAPSAPSTLPVAPTDTGSVLNLAPVTGDGKGEVCIIWAGKGGVGKTTTSVGLAHRASEAGLRVILIDANFGQGDVRIFLRIGMAALPSVYNFAVSGDLRTALIDPQRLNEVRTGQEPLRFAVVQAPPPHMTDASVVTPEVYLRLVEEARAICDLVVIDTQIIESRQVDDPMVDRFVNPLLRAGAWSVGIADLSSAGISNLLTRLKRTAAMNIPRERQLSMLNRVPSDLEFNQQGVAQAFGEHSAFLGSVMADKAITESMNRGQVPGSFPNIAFILNTAIGQFRPEWRVLSERPEQPSTEHKENTGKRGLLGRRRR